MRESLVKYLNDSDPQLALKKYNFVSRLVDCGVFLAIALAIISGNKIIILLVVLVGIFGSNYITDKILPELFVEYLDEVEVSTLDKFNLVSKLRLAQGKSRDKFKYLNMEEINTFLYPYILNEVSRENSIHFKIYNQLVEQENYQKLGEADKFRVINFLVYYNKFYEKFDAKKYSEFSKEEAEAIMWGLSFIDGVFNRVQMYKNEFEELGINVEEYDREKW